MESLPACPSTVSRPSPACIVNTSSPAPRLTTSAAALAVDEVVAVAAAQRVGAVAAGEVVVAGAAVRDELERVGRAAAVDLVLAREPVDRQLVAGRVGVHDVDEGRQADDGGPPGGGADGVDDVVLARAVEDQPVRPAREVRADLLHAGARDVTDRQRVVAAERGDVEPLDATAVERARSDVSRQPCARAVGGQSQLVGAHAAVEAERVEPSAALDRVVAAVAVEEVIAVAAVERVGAAAADERVRPALALEGRRRRGGAADPGVVDADAVGAVAREHADAVEARARDPELGRSVVADVDLERRRRVRRNTQRELLARGIAGDEQCPVLDRGREGGVRAIGGQRESGGERGGGERKARANGERHGCS